MTFESLTFSLEFFSKQIVSSFDETTWDDTISILCFSPKTLFHIISDYDSFLS